MKPTKLFYATLFICSGYISKAQTDSSEKQKPQFKFGLNYNSELNYYGRTDSLKSTGFFPLAEFWFSKDVYVSAAPVFVNNAVKSFDYAGTVATLGYLHVTDKMVTNLYLTKSFYKESSQLVQSALEAQGGASLSFLNKIMNFTVGGDMKYSDKLDFGAIAGLDHIIRKELAGNIVLVVDPSFYTYAGTQNFTNTYYKKQKGLSILPGSNQEVKENVTMFSILAYEFSLPLIFAKGKWMGLVTPSYILPQNLVTIPGRPDLSENGRNMFYANAGVKYSF
ncbi:MAG: hypothetical protein ACJ749_17730 [Flavisolibacter sp.]